jgi:hypothetical protein
MFAINRSSPFPIIQVFQKKKKKFLYLVLRVSCLNAILLQYIFLLKQHWTLLLYSIKFTCFILNANKRTCQRHCMKYNIKLTMVGKKSRNHVKHNILTNLSTSLKFKIVQNYSWCILLKWIHKFCIWIYFDTMGVGF